MRRDIADSVSNGKAVKELAKARTIAAELAGIPLAEGEPLYRFPPASRARRTARARITVAKIPGEALAV